MSKRFRADYHLHSSHSPDSQTGMEEMCLSAIRKGFDEIAITDHFECYTPSHPKGFYTLAYLQKALAEVERCQAQFKGQLTIRKGIEMGQPGVNPDWSAEIMNQFSFDYVIGSVHKLRDLDLGLVAYKEAHLEEICLRNLTALYDLAETGDFDCLGHIDLIRRYAARQGIPVDLSDYSEQLEAVLKKLVQRGKGLEINTSGLRQETASLLPGPSVLKLFKELGGEIITIGSDAHGASDVGADWGEAADAALQAGFKYAATFQDRKPSFYKLEG